MTTLQQKIQAKLVAEFTQTFAEVGGGDVKLLGPTDDYVDLWVYPRGIHDGFEWELHVPVEIIEGVPQVRECNYHCREKDADMFVHISDVAAEVRPSVPKHLSDMAADLEARVASLELPKLALAEKAQEFNDVLQRIVMSNAAGCTDDFDQAISDAIKLMKPFNPTLTGDLEALDHPAPKI